VANDTQGAGETEEAPAAGADPILGATLETLRRAAEGVEFEREIAETLQRSLLPKRLPEIPGLSICARYVAGSADARVGGDWYDTIALRDGRVGLTIGDVVGRGVEAAARMARLQSAARAYALEGLRPSLVLERLSGFIADDDRRMATLLYAIVDSDRGTMRLASAGHPPPLVIGPQGAASYSEAPTGIPLGVSRFPLYEESTVALAPGSVVLLYTDGIVERPGQSLSEGLDRLAEAVRGLPPQPQVLCEAVLERMLDGAAPRDDVALVAMLLEPEPGDTLELRLPAADDSLSAMRRSLARWLRAAGASDQESYELLVACGEACANAIAHAYGAADAEYLVTARHGGGDVELVIRDFGRWREPRAKGTRGLRLMAELTEDMDVERGKDGTTVRMRRRLTGVAR
jgi:anti-sigma regulatory factor (Ser/Thr protein kinase)